MLFAERTGVALYALVDVRAGNLHGRLGGLAIAVASAHAAAVFITNNATDPVVCGVAVVYVSWVVHAGRAVEAEGAGGLISKSPNGGI